jgi:AcrR family transcriptional regulator
LPPKTSFTKERIVECGFEIVRREGLGALSARRIAGELGCSTRPVYGSFRSMKELEAAVLEKARDYALSYFAREAEGTNSPFLGLGLRYFRFSREEPELFRLLYMEGGMGDTFGSMTRRFSPLLEKIRQEPGLGDLSEAELRQMGTDSWIYTHGLVAMIYALKPEDAEELVGTRLRRFGLMLMREGREGGGERRQGT